MPFNVSTMPLDRFFLPREDIVRDKGEGGELPGSDGQVLLEKLLKNWQKSPFFGRPLVLLQDSHRPHWTGVYANIQVISSLHVLMLKVQISIWLKAVEQLYMFYIFMLASLSGRLFTPASNLWDWNFYCWLYGIHDTCCRTQSPPSGCGRNTSVRNRRRGRSTIRATSRWCGPMETSCQPVAMMGTLTARGRWQRNIWRRSKTFSPSDNGILTGDRLKSWRKKMSEKSGWVGEKTFPIWNSDPALKMCSPDLTGDNRHQGWKVVDTYQTSRPSMFY